MAEAMCPEIPQWMRMVYYASIAILVYAIYITYVAEKNQFSGQWLYVVVSAMAVLVIDNTMQTYGIEKYLDLDTKCPKHERKK